MRRGPFAVILPAALLVIAAGCSSSSTPKRATPTTPDRATSTTKEPAASRPKGKLEFRAVQYRGEEPLVMPDTATGDLSCDSLVKAAAKRPASQAREEVLFDRTRETCYVLGATLLTGANVDEARALFDGNRGQWVVDVHFSTDEFITRVAAPNVNRIVAIVLDGVVQTAPRINPGITGRDVQISGDYSHRDAIAIAASIRGIAP
jgi:preprotein translocase subunit SecD